MNFTKTMILKYTLPHCFGRIHPQCPYLGKDVQLNGNLIFTRVPSMSDVTNL